MIKKLTLCIIALIISTGCSPRVRYTEPTYILYKEAAYTLKDGTVVDEWREEDFSNDSIYKLSDDTSLLRVSDPCGPENTRVVDQESFRDLSEMAKEKVAAYYNNLGLLYNIEYELEVAYKAYKDSIGSGHEFRYMMVSQEIVPIASNDRIISFITTVMLPVYEDKVKEKRRGAIFDRNTGEKLEVWGLFNITQGEAKIKLLSLIKEYESIDSEMFKKMEQYLKTDNIILFPDRMEIGYEQGVLNDEGHDYLFSIEYSDLDDIMHDWAIPRGRDD